MSEILIKCIELWQQAGDKPHEVLIQEGVYEYFLSELEKNVYDINENPSSDKIYRGLSGIRPKKGDYIEFQHPHSWTEDYEVALHFKGDPGTDNEGVILCLTPNKLLKAMNVESVLSNTFYHESEIIVEPLKLKVVRIQENGDVEVELF